METKSERWALRVTPAQNAIVRHVVEASGMSLNEYVVSCAVAAAANDLADRQVMALGPDQWDQLMATLDRPPSTKPRLAKLLTEPSVLEGE